MKMNDLAPLIGLMLVIVNLHGQQLIDSEGYSIAEKHKIHSEILEEDREIFIYKPKGFKAADEKVETYPLIIVLDGESQFLNTVSAVDFLSSAPLGNDVIPRSIVVGIPNTNRNRDLTPTRGIIGKDSTSINITGGGKAFLGFITDEIIPFLDNNFPTSSHRTLIGHSLGGLIVFEALLNKREYFNNYLAIDPALNYDNGSYAKLVLDSLRTSDLRAENLFLAKANTLPSFLSVNDLDNDDSEIVQITKGNSQFLQLSNSEVWNINGRFQDFPNEDHFSIPYLATHTGMKFFYDFYKFREIIDYCHPSYAGRSDLVERLKAHYRLISERMGYELTPMQSYINSWAYGFANFERPDLSIQLFDYNIELYPGVSTVYNAKAYFLLNTGYKKEALKLFYQSLSVKKDERIQKLVEEIELNGN